MRPTLTALAASLFVAATALAAPPPPDEPRLEREHREQMLRKVHTMMVIELGEILELDTAGTIKLSDRLRKYGDERVRLRLENFDAMQELRQIAETGAGDAAGLARRLVANRVKLAELDARELDDVIAGQPPARVVKIAQFLARFPQRLEHMGRGIADERRGGPGGGRGMGGGMGGGMRGGGMRGGGMHGGGMWGGGMRGGGPDGDF
jgi:hypothetical protein